MPFPSEHAARQASPAGFVTFRRGELPGAPEGISVIFGIRADGSSDIQSVRARASDMSPSEFKQWLAENEMSVEIEEATGPVAATEASTPVALAEGDGPIWVEMLRTGVQTSRFVNGSSASGHGSVEFTEADLESAARGFRAIRDEGYLLDGKAPVGYDHAEFSSALAMVTGKEPDEGEVYSAAAWFSDVKVAPNEDGGHSLLGLHHYTDQGRDRVRAGGFRGYSIDIAPPSSMQRRDGTPISEWVPFGGTLTNSPFIRSMAPLAASEQPPQETTPMQITPSILVALSLSEGATEAAALTALKALSERAAQADALATNLDRVTAERDAKAAEVEALSERQMALTIRQAVHDGRCSLAEGDDYWSALEALGEERAHRIFPAGKVPTTPGVAPTKPEDPAPPESADAAFDRTFRLALSEGKDEREAYRIADIATRDLRNAEYGTPLTNPAAEA